MCEKGKSAHGNCSVNNKHANKIRNAQIPMHHLSQALKLKLSTLASSLLSQALYSRKLSTLASSLLSQALYSRKLSTLASSLLSQALYSRKLSTLASSLLSQALYSRKLSTLASSLLSQALYSRKLSTLASSLLSQALYSRKLSTLASSLLSQALQRPVPLPLQIMSNPLPSDAKVGTVPRLTHGNFAAWSNAIKYVLIGMNCWDTVRDLKKYTKRAGSFGDLRIHNTSDSSICRWPN
ncbi:hypothetical protein L211DRAFT_847084 [Terfezia boudieri ATCC MYA-4762]|uniref:Uncharacterized protein n=1 Tax=Terfezia boudieri ATCC MYA-4762 TaxID=1051890 RepID=A0A3N4LU43_9PEZI|nr:hypothetical protein L211DRAFT_847084 [Terfezia boudieri ATCC MYA-4762]